MKKKSSKEFRQKALKFTIKFFLIFAVLYALLFIIDFSPLENSIASLEAKALSLHAVENRVQINSELFAVTESCIGLFSGIVLFAIIFACRKPSAKTKIAIAFFGAALLFVINLFRLYFVLAIGKSYGLQAAETTHVISWLATSAFILIIWYYLTKKIVKKEFQELI